MVFSLFLYNEAFFWVGPIQTGPCFLLHKRPLPSLSSMVRCDAMPTWSTLVLFAAMLSSACFAGSTLHSSSTTQNPCFSRNENAALPE